MIEPQTQLAAWRLQCEMSLMGGKKHQALKIYERILAVHPDPFLFTAKASLMENLQQPAAALESFQQALRRTSQNEESRREIMRLLLAQPEASVLKNFVDQSVRSKTVASNELSVNSDWNCNRTEVLDHQAITEDSDLFGGKTETFSHSRFFEDSDRTEIVTASDATISLLVPGQSAQQIDEDIFVLSGVDPGVRNNFAQTTSELVDAVSIVDDSAKVTHDDNLVVDNEKTIIAASNAEPLSPSIIPTRQMGKSTTIQRVAAQYHGRYEILAKLGEGGMGTVYKAYDPQMDRTIALKVIRGETMAGSAYAVRFLQEIKATARLNHPNIVAIYDSGERPQYYFTMEYIAGRSLAQIINEGIFKPIKAAQILEIIAAAIGCAHTAKIIHRDLKPANIMIDAGGQVKVMDFGLAKVQEEGAGLSKSGDVVGTPVYMAPEQAQGRAVDGRIDVYAIGAIGYEMVTGKPLFRGENVFAILNQVEKAEPLRPRAINSEIDLDLETIILKCLEKAPDKRYQTVTELADDLRRYIDNRPILARPPGPVARLGKWIKRNKELSVTLATIVVSITLLFAYIFYQWRGQIAYNRALNMAKDVMRWDPSAFASLQQYEKKAEAMFKRIEALSSRSGIYHYWGMFWYKTAQLQTDYSQVPIYYRYAQEKFKRAVRCNCDDYRSYYYLLLIEKRLVSEDSFKYYDRIKEIVLRLKLENEFTDIIKVIDRLVQLNGRPPQRKQLKEFLADLHHALRYGPTFPCAHQGLARTHFVFYLQKPQPDDPPGFKLDHLAKCRQHWDAFINIEPTYASAYICRGSVSLLQALATTVSNELAPAKIDEVRKDFARGLDLCLITTGRQQKSSQYYYRQAQIYSQKKQLLPALCFLGLSFLGDRGDWQKVRQDPQMGYVVNSMLFQESLAVVFACKQ